MPILQKCPPSKTSSKFTILLILNLFLMNAPVYTQTPGKDSSSFAVPLKLCRTYFNPNSESSLFASDNANLLFVSPLDHLNSISLLTGNLEWQTDLGGRIKTPPYLAGEGIFILSEFEQKNGINTYSVRRLDKGSGLVIWKTNLSPYPLSNSDYSAIKFYLHTFEGVLAISSSNGDISVLDAVSGKLIRQKSFGYRLSSIPFFSERKVTFGTLDQRVITIPLTDLSKTDDFQIPETATSVARIGSLLIWGDEKGLVTSSDDKSRKWKFLTGAKVTHILVAGENLLVFSLDNFTYSISKGNGQIKWKKRVSERFVFTPLAVDHDVVIVPSGLSAVLFIDVSSGRTINKVNLPGASFFEGSPEVFANLAVFPTNLGLLIYSYGNCP